MNFRTESLDFPQNEQRRCLSCDMTAHSTGDACAQTADIQTCTAPLPQCAATGYHHGKGRGRCRASLRTKDQAPAKQETNESVARYRGSVREHPLRNRQRTTPFAIPQLLSDGLERA